MKNVCSLCKPRAAFHWCFLWLSRRTRKVAKGKSLLYHVGLNVADFLSLSCIALHWRVALTLFLHSASWRFFSIQYCYYCVRLGAAKSFKGHNSSWSAVWFWSCWAQWGVVAREASSDAGRNFSTVSWCSESDGNGSSFSIGICCCNDVVWLDVEISVLSAEGSCWVEDMMKKIWLRLEYEFGWMKKKMMVEGREKREQVNRYVRIYTGNYVLNWPWKYWK